MTNEEKIEQLRVLDERQIALSAVMSQSDAHASKCVKLNLVYSEQYPDECQKYELAREQYNRNEEEIARIKAIEPEDTPHEDPQNN